MPVDEQRFAGIARLYGREGAERLAAAHVAVVGIGGVGSWAAEALARSGVGEISLFDLDDVCVTNTNRQVQLGRPAVKPPGAAREDFAVLVEMGRRLGLDWSYSHPSEVFAEMKRIMPSLDNITWERLEREGAVTYPVADEAERSAIRDRTEGTLAAAKARAQELRRRMAGG